jgi:amino acid transporter
MSAEGSSNHGMKRVLGLRDLVPMQILLVVGITWAGNAALVGSSHVVIWLAAILFLFVPLAAVTGWCAKIWPLEGGVYQWTKFAFGPFAGFMTAWNFALWALLAVSNLGILSATSLSYGLGSKAAWMQNSHALIGWMSLGLFGFILLINIPGFGIGKWVSHFGTAVTVLVTVLLMGLLFVHPHTSAAHPHVSPQRPFSLKVSGTMLTLMTLNLFTKVAFNALSGLEQAAVFAGETRDPGRTILRSAWIAAPVIAVIYILMTGSILTYVPAAKVDLTGPIPQVLAAAFGGGTGTGVDWGLVLGRATILVLAVALVAQFAVIVAETSRLPLVAGWEGILPAWFTRLDPRWKTPTRSILVIVLLSLGLGFVVTFGTGTQEAFQLLTSAGNISYGMYYLLMFAIPLAVGDRFGTRAGFWLKAAAVSGLVMTVLSMVFNLMPIVQVSSQGAFAAKVTAVAVAMNLVGVGIYGWGTRRGVRAVSDVY